MSSFNSSNHVKAQRIGYYFWDADYKPIDEYIELKLIKHQCRCVELKDDSALKQNAQKSGES